ncbi:hypothetical protein [Demequina gelatinilytica]|uniref:hypothetical protein n=1 Tax=Demequina gelatinilytica TaxID=1638980 RepID=UPI000783EAEA|nr:hypothetical protein [Demequina gelatinilytica]
MAWTLTSAVARIAGLVGVSERRPAEEPATTDPLFVRAFQRAVDRASAADAKALGVARDQMGDDAPVLFRAVASGAPVSAIAALAAAWETLDPEAREAVGNPVMRPQSHLRWVHVEARQVDQTTCGAATMAAMLMQGDPFVALWVVTGRTLADYIPPEVLAVMAEDAPVRGLDERWNALQRVLHAQTTTSAIGPVAWPRSLGTPPWKVDDHTRFAGLRFRGAIVDDSSPETLAPVLSHARRALADGIPVPLYASGDSSLGLDSVIPRHVVLLVGDTGDGFLVYEPGTARVLPLADADMRPGAGRQAALGSWSRASWVVLPVPRRA